MVYKGKDGCLKLRGTLSLRKSYLLLSLLPNYKFEYFFTTIVLQIWSAVSGKLEKALLKDVFKQIKSYNEAKK